MVTIEEIKKLASLAKLRLTDEELARMAKSMTSIIAFADTINTVRLEEDDKAGAPRELEAHPAPPLRHDGITASLPAEAILRNAGEARAENGYFRIRKRR